VRLDEGEEEESEVTQEAQAGMGRGGRNRKRREDRRQMRRRWRKLGRGEERKGKGMRREVQNCLICGISSLDTQYLAARFTTQITYVSSVQVQLNRS